MDIVANCKSGKQKDSTDGDNIKIYTNGGIILNPKAPTSDKYKNFFFSGDQMQGSSELLMIGGDQFLFEDGDFALEIWYDKKPLLERVKVELKAGSEYDNNDTTERKISRLVELSKLPLELQKEGFHINETVAQARNYGFQYADEHDFFIHNEKGQKILLTQHNEVDACRHFTWNVLLTRELGNENAELITTNHEIFWRNATNKTDFPRSGVMDLWNNEQGRKYAVDYPQKEPLELFELALSEKNIITSLESITIEKQEVILNLLSKFLETWEK